MTNIMAVLLDGIAQLEYDRNKPLPEHQAQYLDKMDHKMDGGIMVGSANIENPDLHQRTEFIAANLAHAIINNQETVALAMCSYLADRLPDLKQVKIETQDNNVAIELVFDEEYRKQVPVKLIH